MKGLKEKTREQIYKGIFKKSKSLEEFTHKMLFIYPYMHRGGITQIYYKTRRDLNARTR